MQNRFPPGDDDYLHIARESNDALKEVAREQGSPSTFAWTCQEYLRSLVSPGKIHQRRRDLGAIQNSRHQVHVAGKIQVTLNRLSFGFRQMT